MVLKSVVLTCLGLALLAEASAQQVGLPPASSLTAAEILDRQRDVYANCKSYRDAGVVETTITHVFEAGAALVGVVPVREPTYFSKPFRTAFVRPGHFRFESFTARGRGTRHSIVWQGNGEVRTWWDVAGGEGRPSSFASAIAGATGVSGGSAHMVPRLLLPQQVTGTPITLLANAERLEDALLDAVPCYRIQGLFPPSGSTVMLWIDQGNFLLRRIEQKSDVKNLHMEIATTYEPDIDVEISPGELLFDPPAERPDEIQRAQQISYRFGLATGYIAAGAADEALPELEALWNATGEDSPANLFGTRRSLIETIRQLAPVHEATRVSFTAIFDELDEKVRKHGRPADRPGDAWKDWAKLGRALKLDDRILQLYLERRSPTGSLRLPEDFHPDALDDLFEILMERRLYAEAGRLWADPLERVESAYSLTPPPDEDGNDPGDWQDAVGQEVLEARTEVSRLYALLLAAERADEAESVARLMLERDDTTEARRALVLACLRLEIPCAAMPTWMAEIRRRGGTVADIEALMAAPSAAASR